MEKGCFRKHRAKLRDFCLGGEQEAETKLTSSESRIRRGQKGTVAGLTWGVGGGGVGRTGLRAKPEEDPAAPSWKPASLQAKWQTVTFLVWR